MKKIDVIIKKDGSIGSYTMSGGGHLTGSTPIEIPDGVYDLTGYKYIDGKLVEAPTALADKPENNLAEKIAALEKELSEIKKKVVK